MEAIGYDFHGVSVNVIPEAEYEYLMPTQDVAAGFGVSVDAIQAHKTRNSDELVDGKHWIPGFIEVDSEPTICRNRKYHLEHPNKHWRKGGQNQTREANLNNKVTLWTKRGVVRLGFLIKSDRAKIFRDWAEDLVLRELNKTGADIAAVLDELRHMRGELALISEHFNPKVLHFNRKLMRERRKEMGLTQAELAALIGVEQVSIANVERGAVFMPEPQRIKKIAKVLGLSVKQLTPNAA